MAGSAVIARSVPVAVNLTSVERHQTIVERAVRAHLVLVIKQIFNMVL
jgi:hypothetical protein